MEALLVSTGAVAIAEIGDKTQLLALVLACRFQRPLPIIAGILVATLANHAAAGFAGAWIGEQIDPSIMRWILGASFLAVAVWALVPDSLDGERQRFLKHAGPFLTTLVTFFLVEIGDKTQVATVGLAIRYDSLFMVVVGTTLGMMIANAPIVLCGEALARRLPLRYVRFCAAAIFAVLGISVLFEIL
jgi:putative Ca2+/H+ antiporter (TMEM165/GDT1 family)